MTSSSQKQGNSLPVFSNDEGRKVINVSVRSFGCMGMSPPLDHPHVYLVISPSANGVVCPYCSTRFQYR